MPDERDTPFQALLPEIYQEVSLLTRILSVFEMVYLESEQRIDSLPDLYRPEQTPEELLPLVGRLVGLQDDSGLFSPDLLRDLLPTAFQLQRWKGTRWALEEILARVLRHWCGHPVSFRIVEYRDFCDAPEESRGFFQKRFGGPADVTVVVPREPALCSGDGAARLEELVRQYTPASVTPHIAFGSPLGEIRIGQNAVL